jgi:hypothetical protein
MLDSSAEFVLEADTLPASDMGDPEPLASASVQ